jgi:hypothetical protein
VCPKVRGELPIACDYKLNAISSRRKRNDRRVKKHCNITSGGLEMASEEGDRNQTVTQAMRNHSRDEALAPQSHYG